MTPHCPCVNLRHYAEAQPGCIDKRIHLWAGGAVHEVFADGDSRCWVSNLTAIPLDTPMDFPAVVELLRGRRTADSRGSHGAATCVVTLLVTCCPAGADASKPLPRYPAHAEIFCCTLRGACCVLPSPASLLATSTGANYHQERSVRQAEQWLHNAPAGKLRGKALVLAAHGSAVS